MLVVAGVSLAICGCARPPVIPTALPSARVCCQSLAELPMEDLRMEEVRSITFDEQTSPVFGFPEGNGVFAAFRLPKESGGATLNVRTYLSTMVLPMTTLVKPNAMFLDASHHPFEQAREAPLRVRRGGLTRMSQEAVFPVPVGAAYVVVYSGDARARRVQISSENGTVYAIPYSYSGDIDVTLRKAQ
ncbi:MULTISPECIES: MalM family protein [Cupriavidus]